MESPQLVTAFADVEFLINTVNIAMLMLLADEELTRPIV
jgi:hypothetical protein